MNDAAAPSKRRRTSPSKVTLADLPNDQLVAVAASEVTLADLPNDQLVAVADCLSTTARALFAAALTAPSDSWRARGWRGELTEATRLIVASAGCRKPGQTRSDRSPWEELDFGGDLGTSLPLRLTDGDVGAILAVIDAKHTVKRLRLGCCNGLVGDGLYPLRGSLALEEMDLGLVGKRARKSSSSSSSISSSSDSDLSLDEEIQALRIRNRQFDELPPYVDTDLVSLTPEAVLPILNSIIDKEGNSLRAIEFPPSWCEGELRMKPHMRDFSRKFTRLLSHCCEHREGWTAPAPDPEFRFCEACFTCVCKYCENVYYDPCDHCNMFLCADCGFNQVECWGCGKVNCGICAKREGADIAAPCSSHGEGICLDCMKEEGNEECAGCREFQYPVLMAGYERLETEKKDLQEENDKLRREVEELREKLEMMLSHKKGD